MVAAPEEVKDAIRSELAVKANVNASTAKRKTQSADVENAGDAERARLVQGRQRHEMVEACQVHAALSDFFDSLGIVHSKVNYCVATSNKRTVH